MDNIIMPAGVTNPDNARASVAFTLRPGNMATL
jgi:spermidine/putrescine-binding protein